MGDSMNKITDDDLTLLYYGEHDDPRLATEVAGSPELSARFDALSAELKLADAFVPPERGDDYGAEVWQKISPRLQLDQPVATGKLHSWISSLGKPRFSFAGVTAVAMLTVIAFLLGRQDGPGVENTPLNSPENPMAISASIDPGRLLNRSVAGHLEQVNLVLTDFANLPETSSREAEQATDMLLTNRLYRKAAAARGDQQLAAFLAGLVGFLPFGGFGPVPALLLLLLAITTVRLAVAVHRRLSPPDAQATAGA